MVVHSDHGGKELVVDLPADRRDGTQYVAVQSGWQIPGSTLGPRSGGIGGGINGGFNGGGFRPQR